jgi:hypothetical protein
MAWHAAANTRSSWFVRWVALDSLVSTVTPSQKVVAVGRVPGCGEHLRGRFCSRPHSTTFLLPSQHFFLTFLLPAGYNEVV